MRAFEKLQSASNLSGEERVETGHQGEEVVIREKKEPMQGVVPAFV